MLFRQPSNLRVAKKIKRTMELCLELTGRVWGPSGTWDLTLFRWKNWSQSFKFVDGYENGVWSRIASKKHFQGATWYWTCFDHEIVGCALVLTSRHTPFARSQWMLIFVNARPDWSLKSRGVFGWKQIVDEIHGFCPKNQPPWAKCQLMWSWA